MGKLEHRDRNVLLDALSDTPHFATVRGRQTMIRDALGGYPLSGEIEKALRFLDWEGSPIVVADKLLRLLDGLLRRLQFRRDPLGIGAVSGVEGHEEVAALFLRRVHRLSV